MRSEDREALARLALESFAHLPAGLAEMQVLARERDRSEAHARAERLVLERDGAVIGTGLVDRSGDPWLVVDLEVTLAARRTGAGRALVAALLAGAPAVELQADPMRPDAVPFWTALGFRPIGPGDAGAVRMRRD